MAKRKEELRAKLPAIEAELLARIATLLSAEQSRRLLELRYRASGPLALVDRDVAKQVGLQAEQLAILDAAADDAAERFDAIRPTVGSSVPFDSLGGYWYLQREIAEIRNETMLAVLTAEQLKLFHALQGEAFDLARLRVRSQFPSRPPLGRAPIGDESPPGEPRSEPDTATKAAGDVAERYIRYATALIGKYDRNGDGVLMPDEWKSMQRDPSAADTDEDGRLTPREVARWIMGK